MEVHDPGVDEIRIEEEGVVSLFWIMEQYHNSRSSKVLLSSQSCCWHPEFKPWEVLTSIWTTKCAKT